MFYSIFMSTELSPGWAELIWTVRIANVLRSCYLFYYSFFCFFLFLRLFSIHLEWSTTCAAHWHRADAVTDCEEKKWVVPIARSRALNKTTTTAAAGSNSRKKSRNQQLSFKWQAKTHRLRERDKEWLTDSQLTPSLITHTLSHINCILIIMNKPISDEEKN